MKIRIVAFATASDILGRQGVEVELPAGARLSDLRALLEGRYPALVPLWTKLAIAVDGALVSDPATVLEEGVEIALLPPVSGGGGAGVAVASPPATDRAALTDERIDVAAVERQVSGPACGAVLLFLGNVRDHHAGRPVARLDYSAYRPMAVERLRTIVEELEAEGDRLRLAIVHRLGTVPVGEASVVIAAASPHRAAAYDASRVALERLKKEVPIWKREHYADGEVAWREEEPLG